ncbi:MAG: PIN domain-containing protein [Actinomycetota bacterium]|nr:PIN domain-containing protein [Actinomycetota bacterium]
MIFVDTSFWFAWQVATDVNHSHAVALFERHAPQQPLLTSDRVCEETWTLLRRRRGHRQAVAFMDTLRSSGTRVSTRVVTPALADEAWAWLRQRDERGYSFVDASSFVLMDHLGAREALAFDGDFAAAGFVELR